MTITTRAAVALAALFLIAGSVATFLPTTSSGPCGTWVAPEWTANESAQTAAKFHALAVQFRAAGADQDAADAEANSVASANVFAACADKLAVRRNIAAILFGLAALIPACVLFVGRGRRSA